MSATESDTGELVPASPIDLPSIPDVIYHQLRRDIGRGVYRPGPIRIRPLAERFGVSATPVREALRRLEAEGLVTLRKNQIVVNSLSETELREIFAIRAELEVFALRRGAEKVRKDPRLLAELESQVATMDLYDHDPEDWRAANESFHMKIYHAAGMPRLSSMIDSLWIAVEPYLRLYVSTAGSFRASQEQHRSILDHLRSGRAKAAADVLRKHLQETEEIVAKGINSAGADEG
ncbi:MAG: GntR family transcriptional regulator [Solirubrobacterales bacterium]|nr:GntR family transcriptional regulator [Solirubrobacterales bacterium]MBV9537142.1 GntR family transcriptional regulator [Solirubrobacterales bacterium]